MGTVGNGLSGDVMLQLGELQFSVGTAAYQELARASERRWAAIPRFGQHDALQDLGPGEETIRLSGVVFPEFRGGTGQPDAMRELQTAATPSLLVDGLGNVHGLWVLLTVEERQNLFAAAGVPRRQEFTLSLRKFSDDNDL